MRPTPEAVSAAAHRGCETSHYKPLCVQSEKLINPRGEEGGKIRPDIDVYSSNFGPSPMSFNVRLLGVRTTAWPILNVIEKSASYAPTHGYVPMLVDGILWDAAESGRKK